MKPGTLDYDILNECKCGYEELCILVSLVQFESSTERDKLIKTLVRLFASGLLDCEYAGEKLDNLTEDMVREHLINRLIKGEDLAQYPEDNDEYCFFSTEAGISVLLDDDKPVVKS
jgi:hypothetical protein